MAILQPPSPPPHRKLPKAPVPPDEAYRVRIGAGRFVRCTAALPLSPALFSTSTVNVKGPSGRLPRGASKVRVLLEPERDTEEVNGGAVDSGGRPESSLSVAVGKSPSPVIAPWILIEETSSCALLTGDVICTTGATVGGGAGAPPSNSRSSIDSKSALPISSSIRIIEGVGDLTSKAVVNALGATGLGPSWAITAPPALKARNVPLAGSVNHLPANRRTLDCPLVNWMTNGPWWNSVVGLAARRTRIPE